MNQDSLEVVIDRGAGSMKEVATTMLMSNMMFL